MVIKHIRVVWLKNAECRHYSLQIRHRLNLDTLGPSQLLFSFLLFHQGFEIWHLLLDLADSSGKVLVAAGIGGVFVGFDVKVE